MLQNASIKDLLQGCCGIKEQARVYLYEAQTGTKLVHIVCLHFLMMWEDVAQQEYMRRKYCSYSNWELPVRVFILVWDVNKYFHYVV